MASGFVPILIYGCRRMFTIRPSRLKFSRTAGIMRVYVDRRLVYFTFTFTNSINMRIFVTPSQNQLEAMDEDKQGYISPVILNATVTSQSLSTVRNISKLARMAILLRSFSSRIHTTYGSPRCN